jgi:hypothetical protein
MTPKSVESVAGYAVSVVEHIASVTASDGDRQRLESACAGKTRGQVDAARSGFVEAFNAGKVKAPFRYFATCIANQPAIPDAQLAALAHAERVKNQRARQLGQNLAVDWDQYRDDLLRAVTDHLLGIAGATAYAWDECKRLHDESDETRMRLFMAHLTEMVTA